MTEQKHSAERIAPFTDAVVAIAMTLLVLPLVDSAATAAHDGALTGLPALMSTLGHSVTLLLGFVISFFVIARLWWAHHAIFEHVTTWTTGMAAGTVAWLFTVVLLPWFTSLATTFAASWLLALLYVGDMTASSLMLSLLARAVLAQDDGPAARERYYGNLTTSGTFVVALVLCVLFPALYYAPLALLALDTFVDRAVRRRLRSADTDR